ncbi:MAG: MmcQ/YjbR family DNA-binding protein [Acidobacteria bacterium]|nr:MmcQ/YjbR family DNA-binding protein [Acidobacteriota bacterium]
MQWEHDLLFRVGGKIFAAIGLGGAVHTLSFKCTPEEFSELVEREDIVPAPYLARYHWVCLQRLDALGKPEIKSLITDSYAMVFAKLPKKQRDAPRNPAGGSKK